MWGEPDAKRLKGAVDEADATWRGPLLAAQRQVFATFVKSEWTEFVAPLSIGGYINAVVVGKEDAPALVVLHGFGTGIGFWASNIDALAAHYRVFVLDWLGCGGSARPKFMLGWTSDEAEHFFVDALHDWVVETRKHREYGRALEKPFSILAHSLGGYLSVSFTEKYPHLVKSLVLASPVGIPQAPANKLPPTTEPIRKRMLFSFVFLLWGYNYTPQFFIRLGGSYFGRSLAGAFINSRFPAMSDEERKALAEYMYCISVPPPCGEYAINHILEPGAWARKPLSDRLPKLSQPVTFLYGMQDWMSWQHAEDVRQKMAAASIHVIDGAGHHLYIQKPDEFNGLVLDALRSSATRETVIS